MSLLSNEVSVRLEAFHWNLAGLTEMMKVGVMPDLIARAIQVEAAAKRNASGRPGPNVITGRLRGSITWKPGEDAISPYVDVGTNVFYACVFGARTNVRTKRGMTTIGQLQVGELVLTQAGDWQPVLAKTAFPAIEKPDLVEIAAEWRSGREHRLTLTLDHKVLCHRDGRNLWVCAGDLRDGDLVYDRKKISPDKGSGRWRTCERCDRRHQGQGRRYCSPQCRDAAWAAGANPHLGVKRSAATREKLRADAIRRGSGTLMNRRLAQKGFRTSCERQVEEWLIERGAVYETQVPIGGHVVDFYLPDTREILEADGAYWHRDQDRDIERDRELLSNAPGVEITHLHFYDKRFTPEPLVAEPLPGVRYVSCNPGPDSYVDQAMFRPVPVRVLRGWRYGDKLVKPHGGARALLYDVAIQGVHSFLANGLIISNSFVELGTSRAPAYPFLKPALEYARLTA